MDDPRQTLLRLSGARGESLSALSRMIGRNVAYLHQFVHRGAPRQLADADRRLLAAHLGVDEVALGASAPIRDTIDVPYFAVRAAAGAGQAVIDERPVRHDAIAAALLRETGVRPEAAALLTASGDSMAPGILGGDRLLIDRDRRRPEARGHPFVFSEDGALSVKRLSLAAGRIAIVSDNPAYPPRAVAASAIAPVGRVALLIRRPD